MLTPVPGASGAMTDARILGYDTGRFPFAALVNETFRVTDLRELHARVKGLAEPPSYDDNVRLRSFLRARLEKTPFFFYYSELMRTVVAPLFAMHVSYSRRPQFRVHLAGSPSASAWHTDKQVTGRDDQINIWLPFACTLPANTLWIETDYGCADYAPFCVDYGQMLLFDGGRLAHGTVGNDSGQTRVSIDFRFAPLEDGALARFLTHRTP